MFSKAGFSVRRIVLAGFVGLLLVSSALVMTAASLPPSYTGWFIVEYNGGRLWFQPSQPGPGQNIIGSTDAADTRSFDLRFSGFHGGNIGQVSFAADRVGIGTADPQEKLHVTGSSGQVRILIEGPQTFLTFNNTLTSTRLSAINFETGNVVGWSEAVDIGGYNSNNLSFSDGLANQTRLFIDPSGNVGIGNFGPLPGQQGNPSAKLHVVGDLIVTGTKSFVQDDPTDPGKQIVYVSLEGPEAGTYIRGTANVVNGEATVELPEHFSMVTGDEGLTVQLTPLGDYLQLYVVEKSTTRLVIREGQSKSGQFDYLVQGVRKGYENQQVIQDKMR